MRVPAASGIFFFIPACDAQTLRNGDTQLQAHPAAVLVGGVNPQLGKQLAGSLRALGCDVTVAKRGLAVLSQVMERKPDIVFLDAALQGLDGYRTCALIKGYPRLRRVPVVVVAKQDHIIERARARLAGADGFVSGLPGPEVLSDLLRVHVAGDASQS